MTMSSKRQRFCLLGCVLAGLAWAPASQAGITVTAPNLDVDYRDTSAEFTITAEFTGGYDVNWYEVDMSLAPRGGVSGVTFNSAVAADSDYILGGAGLGWSISIDEDFHIYGDDVLGGDTDTVAWDDATANMITVKLSLALDESNVGDVYDLTFDADFSGIFGPYDDDLKDWPEWAASWNAGTITVTPEPATLSLLGLGGPALLRRRKKK
jgi:hypothetical protein